MITCSVSPGHKRNLSALTQGCISLLHRDSGSTQRDPGLMKAENRVGLGCCPFQAGWETRDTAKGLCILYIFRILSLKENYFGNDSGSNKPQLGCTQSILSPSCQLRCGGGGGSHLLPQHPVPLSTAQHFSSGRILPLFLFLCSWLSLHRTWPFRS